MRLSRYASLSHYADHIDPIWDALPETARGASWSPFGDRPGTSMPGGPGGRERPLQPVLVASWPDAVTYEARRRPLIYLEHGVGQTYEADPTMAGAAGWAGNRDPSLRRTILFLCPNETVAAGWRARFDAPAVAVGCPKLDAWHRGDRPKQGPPTVAVTGHWDCPLGPETRSALPHFDRALPGLARWAASNGVRLMGHGHPRAWGGPLLRRWSRVGVVPVRDFATVLDQADVLVADNTSALYEFASLDRPTVVLNAPWYRRDVHHGLRFWDAVPGGQVDDPDDLVPAVEAALRDPAATAGLRATAVARAYAATDGRAAERAAAAIMEVLAP